MKHRFIGMQVRGHDPESASDYVRTYIYDSSLTEYASFESGDPIADFASATEYCANSDFEGVYVISSSVDDLFLDVPGYRFDPDAGEYGTVVVDDRDRTERPQSHRP